MSDPPPLPLPEDAIAGYLLNEPAAQTSQESGPRLDEVEEEMRVRGEERFQQELHEEVFRDDNEEGMKKKIDVDKLIESWQARTVKILCIDGSLVGSLVEWASASDFVLAAGRQDARVGGGEGELVLHLEEFGLPSVKFFNEVYVKESPHDPPPCLGQPSVKLSNEVYVKEIPPPDLVIELLELARFVGCSKATEQLSDFVASNIDADNVASICQLADRLNLPSLFEESLSFIMKKLEDVRTHPFYSEMTNDLQRRLSAMQSMVKSSIIGSGQRSNLFFSSSDEFLSIFSDSLRDQRERLWEAKRRNDEVYHQRKWRGPGSLESVNYAQGKIEKQEERLKTLEVFLAEQKKIFKGGGQEEPISFSPKP